MAMRSCDLPPGFSVPQTRGERIEHLEDRLRAARLDVVTAQTPERLQEIADEIDAVAFDWNKEKRK